MDTLDEITPENPVPWVVPSSDETPPPPQTTQEQQNETTALSTESALQSAASNDVNDENEIEMLTMSNKRTLHEDSSEEDTNNPLPTKKAATSSPASQQSGTHVPKGRGGGDLPKISAFPANAPQPRGPVREISLPHGLPVSQTTQVRDPRVLPKVAEIVQQ